MRLLRRNKSFTSKRSFGRVKRHDNAYEDKYSVIQTNSRQQLSMNDTRYMQEGRMEMGGAYSSRRDGAPGTPQEDREQPPPPITVIETRNNDYQDPYSVDAYNIMSDADIDKALYHMDDAVSHVSTSISYASHHTTKTLRGAVNMLIEAVKDPCACNDMVTDIIFPFNSEANETPNHLAHEQVDRYVCVPQRKKGMSLNISSNRSVRSWSRRSRSRSRSGRRGRVRDEDRFAEC